MDPFAIGIGDVYRLLLFSFRAGALVMTVPVFGHSAIPRQIRIFLALILALSMVPTHAGVDTPMPPTAAHLAVVILSELAVGFLMGFAVIVVFSAVQFAGHIVGLQMGLAVANIYDPMSAGEISLIGQFYYLFSLLIFLLIDGHHMVIEALARSYDLVPVGAAVFPAGIGMLVTDLVLMLFVFGIKIAAPVMVTLYIMNIVLGIVARTVPQMNVFIVGFPLSIGVGLGFVGLSFPFVYIVLEKAFNGLEGNFIVILRTVSGG